MGFTPGSGWSSAGGNGNPLQYSCLENSMDGGAWRATVHGVAKSWTRLEQLSAAQIVLQWTWGCTCPSRLWFSPDMCPGVGLLGHMVALFLVLEGTSIPLSIMAAPVYIPANSATEHSFPHAFSVTERWGVRLLTAQKPINRPGWWEGKFALFQPAPKGEGRHLSKGWLPLTGNQGARALIDRKRGLHAETAQSSLTVIFKFVFSGLTSVILVVLDMVNLQFPVWFLSISLRPVLGIVAPHVMGTVWSSCS